MFTSGEGNDGFCTGRFQVFGRENDVFLFVYLCQNEFVYGRFRWTVVLVAYVGGLLSRLVLY